MTARQYLIDTLGIVGAGAMGRGIAQIAAQAGIAVRLHDANPQAVAAAHAYLADTFAKLVAKGKLDETAANAALARVTGVHAIGELAGCGLVIEAIVENLDAKRALFRELETVVVGHCILASNTSSLSITAIAAACTDPSRVVGYHFFNPVPLMKVVEVIDGLRGDPAAGDALMDVSRRMGHTPVRAKDMPGFIVNHAGRGMNTEGLRVVGEGVASFADVDRIMREQAGFRLGPFELLDLTALDVSHPVMESIYHQFYEEPRFTPSPITGTRLAGGLLGRKSGEGFYRYANGKPQIPDEPPAPATLPARVWVSRRDPRARDAVLALAAQAGVPVDDGATPAADALLVVTPLGLDATAAALDEQLDARRVVALDTLFPLDVARRRTLMTTPATTRAARDAGHTLFAADGVPVTVIRDSTGFVAQRIVATIVNIGCDIAQRRIASPQDIDLAVTLGLGYPHGPLALGDQLGASTILTILRNIHATLGDPRYRPSPWLARRAQLGLSLTQPDATDLNEEPQ
ncbi:3-hydroxyacyl-CoA dehydrogenase [Paraburkholderia caballeronis]|uniref:3-hydroxyacyl-CoA dehydrogenase n=1 Tax=Paraburkholderia caballeronis TaxID=416943 RepID=A0A1H7TCS1_9BURK|nr:3-hydroxyacyl-CoA dehydrogenase [Paraburkholderia caballeronis]PXW22616.1 3-hydroxyacyl-CoA dehydrogenase [Paraburkholderia caballeronis]PXW96719.1 3-hydroxyacyl-CoA dehydrogenase [Paraburkholderia caballeronis]RAJ93346.1 3-hydroxyacyl-CoA dehydrogenase [Paraburkholderia caballeronis]SEC67034.1 3-hydroxyacyl-CoA dehydrogenase [Paraburkholderia caballeronis]SEL82244.1 3-hydroxyacyl-CoA dehydrogenase [Paraburkholderia caballeronis]